VTSVLGGSRRRRAGNQSYGIDNGRVSGGARRRSDDGGVRTMVTVAARAAEFDNAQRK